MLHHCHSQQTVETYLVVVAVKQGEEAGLGTRRALDATEADIITRTLEVAQIPQQLLSSYTSMNPHVKMRCDSATNLKPQGCTLADRSQLRRLEVSEAKRREVAVLLRKPKP